MHFSKRRRYCSVLALSLLALALPTYATQGVNSAPNSAPRRILVLGDSLSAEYGLQRGEGWVALMEARLQQEKIPSQVINASISGETTAGGRNRIAALLALHRPQIVLIELGANDALRGLPLSMTLDHLEFIARSVRESGAQPILIGIQVPPNYGPQYNRQLADAFASVARTQHAELVPFLLKGVADVPDAINLFQADRIHPLASAHPVILNNVWPAVKKSLQRLQK